MNNNLVNRDTIFKIEGNLFGQRGFIGSEFEDAYIPLRRKENRVYEINEVRALPLISKNSSYFSEWKIRQKSIQRVVNNLTEKTKPLNMLEIGCGNGWFSNTLSAIKNSTIIGLDVNLFELRQASQAFGEVPNLSFIHADLFAEIFIRRSFDVIVLAASIQYFPDLSQLFSRLFELLSKDGEIHILDSPIYKSNQIDSAKERSVECFTSIGSPEMKKYYFHHSIDVLRKYNLKIMYNPQLTHNHILRKFIFKNLSPFPWIKITNS